MTPVEKLGQLLKQYDNKIKIFISGTKRSIFIDEKSTTGWINSNGKGVDLSINGITPERAAEIILSNDECVVKCVKDDGINPRMFQCECGEWWWQTEDPKFCPNCGRKVIWNDCD